MPKGRSNCSRLLILQGFWRVKQVVSVVNGKPMTTKNSTRSQPGLTSRLLSRVSTLRPHPGFLAPASLKLIVALKQQLVKPTSSGVSCPGLIEARGWPHRSRRWRTSSGVSCPGLIEA